MKTFLFLRISFLVLFHLFTVSAFILFSLFSFPEFNRLTRKTDRLSESGCILPGFPLY